MHENLWSLCVQHHLEKHNMGLTSFVSKYPQVEPILKGKGWKLEEFMNRWMRLTNEGWDED